MDPKSRWLAVPIISARVPGYSERELEDTSMSGLTAAPSDSPLTRGEDKTCGLSLFPDEI